MLRLSELVGRHVVSQDVGAKVGEVADVLVDRSSVVGISKLARLVEAYAKRLQIQERFTAQIANEPLKVCVSSEFATRHFAETINRPGRKLKFRGDGIEKLPIGFYGDLPEMQFYDVWANLTALT